MKILKIEACNINSLKGKIKIDFENYLKDESLFAITGPTGSGKSTILDIITCALYGRTSRLSNPEALMTQHTGECFCEVEFEIKEQRYRSSWTLRRAKDKSEGKLQASKMEIFSITKNKIITSKKTEVIAYVEHLSGLDFEKFKQSMMLAQGGFDAFLKAKESERSLLLEKITGTQIYAKISTEIYSTYKKFDEEIKVEESALGIVKLLSKELIGKTKELLKEKNQDKKRLVKREGTLKKEHSWLENLTKLEKNHKVFTKELNQSREKREKNRELFTKLALAQKALNIEAIYTKRVSIVKTIEKNEESFKHLNIHLKDLKVRLENRKSGVILSKKMFQDENESYQQKHKIVKQLRAINVEKEIKEKSLEELSAIIASQSTGSKQLVKKLDDSSQLFKALKKEHESSSLNDEIYEQKYLKMDKITFDDNQKEYPLKSKLKNFDELIVHSGKYEEVVERQREIDHVLQSSKMSRKLLKEKITDKEQLSLEAEGHLKSLRKNREQKLLIAKYEKDREALAKGEKCFLCGSEDHPFIEDRPKIDMDKTTLEILEKEEHLNTIKSAIKALEKEHMVVIAKIELESLSFQKLEERRIQLKKGLAQASLSELKEEKETIEDTLQAIVERRKKKIELLEEKTKSEILQKQIASSLHQEEIQIKELSVKSRSLQNVLNKNLNHQYALKNEILTLERQAISTLNIRDVDKYEKELIYKYETAQKKAYEEEKNYEGLQIRWEALTKQFDVLHQELDENKKQFIVIDKKFVAELKANRFNSENTFKKAIVDKETREKLVEICSAIEKEYTQNQTLYRDVKKQLEAHKKKGISKANLTEVEENLKALDLILEALQKEIGSIEKELEIDAQNREKHQKRIKDLSAKRETFKVWVKLNEMIGSADGAKFAKFAQGITLDQLIYLANKQLKRLNSRYELSRSTKEKVLLGVEVVDKFQGNITRSVSTLSGGESFIVSLALALGLSSLASQKISIDSLFLDEGFGSLDDNSLDVALNALSGLQSSGKMIGVISHINALKERIPLQIKIVPNGDGTSKVVM